MATMRLDETVSELVMKIAHINVLLGVNVRPLVFGNINMRGLMNNSITYIPVYVCLKCILRAENLYPSSKISSASGASPLTP
jgi:hypothetical protein